MKKINVFVVLLVLVLTSTLFMGCTYHPTMTASIDGASKNFIFRSSSKVGVMEGLDGMIIIGTTGADRENGEYLTLLIRGAELGTYNLNVTLSTSAKFQCEAIYRPGGGNDTTVYKAKSGTITITKIDKKRVSGTYSFELINNVLDTDVLNVTNGKFEDLRYYSASLEDIADAAFDL